MNEVSKILEEKTGELLTIDGGMPVIDAVRRMVEANVGSLLVTEDEEIVGIVTERDYLRRVALEGRDENAAAVREIMSSPLVVVGCETTIEECMALMTEQRIRHVPVVEGETIVGLVSIGDLVKFTSKRQSVEIQYLTNYITTAG
jgi:signal-transduction protein with cAMP-binding, CBS, and nucleotidyltransferase domain